MPERYLKKEQDKFIAAWRVAHSALSIGAILMFSLVSILPLLNVDFTIKWHIVVLFIISGYSFSFALYLGPIMGHRGLIYRGPFLAKAVYLGNITGAITSLPGTLILLFSAWRSL